MEKFDYFILYTIIGVLAVFTVTLIVIVRKNWILRAQEKIPLKSPHFLVGRIPPRKEIKENGPDHFYLFAGGKCFGWFHPSPENVLLIENFWKQRKIPTARVRYISPGVWETILI